MTLIVALSASTSLLVHLVNPAARALAVGVVVALALAAFRRTTTSLRLLTWTAVLYSALAMPLLQWMLPPLPVPAPPLLRTALDPVPELASQYQQAGIKFREFTAQPAATAPTKQGFVNQSATSSGGTRTPAPAATSPTPAVPFSTSWTAIASALYLALALILLLRFCIGLIFGRKLRLASQAIHDPRLTAKLADHARTAGLVAIPRTSPVRTHFRPAHHGRAALHYSSARRLA